jgi:sialate O-acetylesterase
MKWSLFYVFLLGSAAWADVRLPAIISDHMVLLANSPAPLWGWAGPGEEIKVSLAGATETTTADSAGKWSLKLDKLKASNVPQILTIQGRNTVTVQDVLIGEIWLASGQSNMEMQMKGKQHGAVDHADEEIAAANFPQIRMFLREDSFDIYLPRSTPNEPQPDGQGKWVVCSPETAASFSAVGYFFARELYRKLSQPVGIILAAVGGTPIEAWTSREAQEKVPGLQPMLQGWQNRLANHDVAQEYERFVLAKKAWLKARSAAQKAGQPLPKAPKPYKNDQVLKPFGLFNGMINPLIPYGIRGVIWYQGERNAAGPFTGLYGEQLATLIQDWRLRWRSDFYFAWVQLPRFKAEQKAPVEPNGWGVSVREGMRRALHVPNTAMAITIDLGDEKAGHPTNKADYANRLAMLALHDVYHKSDAEFTGPLFKSAEIKGNTVVLSFDHASGLKAASGDFKGFAIAGEDQKFVWGKVVVDGDQVIVSHDSIAVPAAVRYGWASNPIGNLVNGAGLPASPFRTDDWK